jgi:hypothetical protein
LLTALSSDARKERGSLYFPVIRANFLDPHLQKAGAADWGFGKVSP